MEYTLENKYLKAKISSHGGELCSVLDRVSGREYIWQGDPAVWEEHAPLLFPICGRLKGAEYAYRGKVYPMGLHGFLKESELTAEEASADSLTLLLTENDKTLAHYPFSFRLTLCYRLTGRTLSLTATVENTGEETLPFAFGGHPGIALRMENDDIAEGTLLHFGEDARGIEVYPLVNGPFTCPTGEPFPMPNGELPLNNALFDTYQTLILKHTPHTATLTQTDGLCVSITHSENLPFFCLWKSTDKGASYVCLEPWSGTPNDGVADEVFDTRPNMCRLPAGGREDFVFSLNFRDGVTAD